ncbi:PD-(D/E)XK nuclease family protein [Dactylosporangium sp. CA-139066]|uniref:PD-(D/E)XK nuclease family protein n=1 Tax=Dactylosporangium sp. CA-139066 TaxID=3239930 RepID=UPI003D8A3653
MTDAPEFHWRSVSQFGTYARCSEAFRIEKVEKVKGRPAAWIAGGIGFHEAVDQWETSGRTIDIVNAFEVAYWQEIGRLKEQEPDISRWLRPPRWKPETDIDGRYAKGKEQVAAYRAHALEAPWRLAELPDGSPATEVPFEFRLSETLGLRGSIDAILRWSDGSMRVRDYKTGSKLPGLLQLGVYKLAALAALGFDINHGDYWMSKKGDINGPHDLSRYTLGYVSELMHRLDRGITAGVFLPNVGDACGTCSVADYCSEVGSFFSPQDLS